MPLVLQVYPWSSYSFLYTHTLLHANMGIAIPVATVLWHLVGTGRWKFILNWTVIFPHCSLKSTAGSLWCYYVHLRRDGVVSPATEAVEPACLSAAAHPMHPQRKRAVLCLHTWNKLPPSCPPVFISEFFWEAHDCGTRVSNSMLGPLRFSFLCLFFAFLP